MYLIKELCDLRLKEIAERFGTGSYGAVGWACRGIMSRMESDTKFRDRMADPTKLSTKDLYAYAIPAKTRIPTQLPVPISAAFSLYNPHSQS
ncbi:MAG: hypothetical protein HY694_07235 [Deltaproteobacteria bacterium]|nr:hypothetical protein [Deltaproteobacteria bacterium]